MMQPVISATWNLEELPTLMPRASPVAQVVNSCLSNGAVSVSAPMHTVPHRNTFRQLNPTAIRSVNHAPTLPTTIVVELGTRRSTRSAILSVPVPTPNALTTMQTDSSVRLTVAVRASLVLSATPGAIARTVAKCAKSAGRTPKTPTCSSTFEGKAAIGPPADLRTFPA